MRLGSKLLVFLGLLCLQHWALGQDQAQQGSEQEQILAFCDHPQVKQSVDLALTEFNKQLSTGYKLALYQITQATKTDNSSGTIVHVEFTSRKSDCPAGGDKPWKECDYLSSGLKAPSPCITMVYVTETEFKVQTVHCELEPRVVAQPALCLGCPVTIDVDSEDLKAPLTISLFKFNAMSDSTHFFVINSLTFATRQVVAGFRYRLMFDMRKSNCSKADNEKLSQECHPNREDVELAHCNSTVDVAPWRHEAPETHLECGKGPQPPVTFERRRPSGWTPLRNIMEVEPKPTAAPTSSPPAVANKESSEESLDKPKPSATSPPDSPFHCPSPPWKEFVQVTPAAPTVLPVQEGFSDLDLVG